MSATILHGDCLEQLRALPDNSVDSVVTDPPYGLAFMGKRWDYDVPSTDIWAECLRVLKPGGHLLAFAGTRTQHRMAVRIEDAGFEIRDMIAWVYASGFPKSHNLKDEWDGWGTALKPALEPITVARKPLVGTVAENVQQHGTGAINVDGCRVDAVDAPDQPKVSSGAQSRYVGRYNAGRVSEPEPRMTSASALGRWPANLIHDGSEEVVGLFPNIKTGSVKPYVSKSDGFLQGCKGERTGSHQGDSGSAARFFKCCPQEETCPLCCLPYAEACNIMKAWKNTLASIAEKSGWTSRATSEFIARVNAIGPASERIAPAVKSAGSLCDSCAMSIAVALVAIKTSAFNSEELQAILASTRSCKNSILIPSLASFAELWESIDTTPTTNSLSLLFGSVRDAIANSTRQDTREGEERRFGLSRFAYIPKASKADRDEGCGELEKKNNMRVNGPRESEEEKHATKLGNHHPTVKPTELMRYLCRLVTPPGGVVLDPFMGSGSTGKAAILEGFQFIGCEREAEYVEIARARITAAENERAQELPFGQACEQESPTRDS